MDNVYIYSILKTECLQINILIVQILLSGTLFFLLLLLLSVFSLPKEDLKIISTSAAGYLMADVAKRAQASPPTAAAGEILRSKKKKKEEKRLMRISFYSSDSYFPWGFLKWKK